MDIAWLGHSAFRLKGKAATVITDPFDPIKVGLKWSPQIADIVTISHDHQDHNNAAGVSEATFAAAGPGEYEVKGVAFTGVSSFHDNSEGSERGKNVIYTFNIDGLRVCHLGDLGQSQLTDTQVDEIGDVDILLIPVGGVYTINAAEAAKIVAKLGPKIVIPMHYQIEGLEVGSKLDEVGHFLKEMGKEASTPQPKLTISPEKLPDEPQVVVLEKQ